MGVLSLAKQDTDALVVGLFIRFIFATNCLLI